MLAVLAGCVGGVSTGDANATVTTAGDADANADTEARDPNASTDETANATPAPGTDTESERTATEPAKPDPAVETLPARTEYILRYDASPVADPVTDATIADADPGVRRRT